MRVVDEGGGRLWNAWNKDICQLSCEEPKAERPEKWLL